MSETLTGMFGRYRIERQLGAGAMGAVYLAHDTQLDRLVALKIPKVTAEDGPEILERFLREARAAAALHHPNICPVYDAGVHDGRHFMTTGYISGGPLSEHLKQRAPLSPADAVAFTRKLAAGLAEAHAHNVLHRDLKPGNVMLDARQEPVIVDFGLARMISGDAETLTKTGAVMGTPAYMSPEQVDGDLKRLGPRSDVYSLGVMLYEMLTARLPFTGSIASVLGQIMSREPAPPRSHRPDLPVRLERICLRAMAKSPDSRYPSMQAFSQALADWNKPEDVPDELVETYKANPAPKPVPPTSSTIPIAVACAALAMSAYGLRTPEKPVPLPTPPLPPIVTPAVTLVPKPWMVPAPRSSARALLDALSTPPNFTPSVAPLFPLQPLPRGLRRFDSGPAAVEQMVLRVSSTAPALSIPLERELPLGHLRIAAPDRVVPALEAAALSHDPAIREWAAQKLLEERARGAR